jgi:hypothetical protein
VEKKIGVAEEGGGRRVVGYRGGSVEREQSREKHVTESFAVASQR